MHHDYLCMQMSAGKPESNALRFLVLSCNVPCRYMYWVNRGEKGKTLIEAAGMDGSDRQVLAVVSMEDPLGLTLDYITGRLYWISEYKEVQ